MGCTHLAYSNEHLGSSFVQGLGEAVGFSNDGVDQICFVCKALEEQVAVCSVAICLYVHLRQVRLFKDCYQYRSRNIEQRPYLHDSQELPTFPSLQFLDFQFDVLSLILRCR